MDKCTKCGSGNVKFSKYMNIKIIKCSSCGFDESSVYDIVPEQKASQKAKGKYAIYKTGGSSRTRKIK